MCFDVLARNEQRDRFAICTLTRLRSVKSVIVSRGIASNIEDWAGEKNRVERREMIYE